MSESAYADLVPAPAKRSGPYDDLKPQVESTVAGGHRVAVPSRGEAMEALQEQAPVLGLPGMLAARGGKVLLAAFADLASALPGGSEASLENLRAYSEAPDRPLPVEEGLNEMRGVSSIPTKVAAGIVRAGPAIGASMALGGIGVPAGLAAAVPMSANEEGTLDPVAAAVGAALPGVASAGERAVASALSRLPMKEVAIVLSRDPLRLKGKVVQKFGPVDLSNDLYRQWLEAGGGAVAANAFLLATQAPEILELPEEQRGEAVLDAVAANVGPSLLGFAARKPVSMTLDRMAPDILGRLRDTLGRRPEPPREPRAPVEEAAPTTPPPAETPYSDLVPPAARPAAPPEPTPAAPAQTAPRAAEGFAAGLTTAGEGARPGRLLSPSEYASRILEAETGGGMAPDVQVKDATTGRVVAGVTSPGFGNAKWMWEIGPARRANAERAMWVQYNAAVSLNLPVNRLGADMLWGGPPPGWVPSVENGVEVYAPPAATPAPPAEDFEPDVDRIEAPEAGVEPPALSADVQARLDSLPEVSLGRRVAAKPMRAVPKKAAPAPASGPTPAPTPVPAPPPAPVLSYAGESLANYVANTLREGKEVPRINVVTKGAEMGLTEKESEEWAELGSTEAARTLAQAPDMTDREKFAALVSLYDRMPRSSTRSLETKVNQQYSTPPPIAFLGAVLADFAHGTAFADITAGHGMTMIGAKAGGRVVLNELDPGRFQRLSRFARPYQAAASLANGDATDPELLRSLLGGVDRMGLNSPFGSVLGPDGKPRRFPLVGGSTRAKDTSALDQAIPLNSLELARPDVKAFIIMGAKTGTPFAAMGDGPARAAAYKKASFLEFFDRFNVVDWFTIGGDLYRKMGAGWPVDVVVIHGKGRTKPSKDGGVVRPWVTPPRVIERWEDLATLIPENTHDNIKPRGASAGSTGGGTGGTGAGAGSGGPGGPRKPAVHSPRPESFAPEGGSGGRGGSDAPDAGAAQPAARAPGGVPGESGAGIGKGTPEPTQPVAAGGTKARQPRPLVVGGGGALAPGANDARARVTPSVSSEGLPASLLVPYVGASKGGSLNLVAPRNIAGQMLAAQRALEAQVGMPVDEFVADRLGRGVAILQTQLAGAQIDAVALAIRNIERGTGLITADETGVGKGRVVAALMEYARLRGLVPVFVTAKKNLYTDMLARDLPALGNRDFQPFITDNDYYLEDGRGREFKVKRKSSVGSELMAGVVRTGKLPEGTQAIFTTYDQLKSDRPAGWKETPQEKFARKSERQSKPAGPRWAMLRAIAPRAIFILDEAHLAAGKDSEVNLQFEGILPAARGTYYSSATFAKRPDNLGLYALGTSIKAAGLDAEQLAASLSEGGVPMQQALTSMLAEEGELVRRQQDWTGVEMRFKATSADPAREIEAADTYTSFIRDLMTLAKQVNVVGQGLADGEAQVAPDDVTVSLEPIAFGNRLFNLSNQYLLSLRSGAIVEEAVSHLKAGRKPFVALYNTMEGPILDLKARKLPLSFNGMLRREMAKMLTITIRDPRADGGKRRIEITPEALPDGGEFYRELESQIDATDFSRFPISPIDAITRGIREAGYSVAEMTARDGQVDDTGGEVVVTKRDRQERTRVLRAYNDGDVDVLIVNGSGSTGLSAHTDPKFKDQRQRAMIVGQPAPDINEFMQMLGRVMRSGQTSKPVYRILTTALAAERRFATMLRGKMTSLNANTTAEGESGMTQSEGFSDDIFNEIGDQIVYRVMEANEDLLDTIQVSLPEGGPDEGFARYVTGRFVLLPNADAQRLWDEIGAEYRQEIEQLDEAGQNPLRAVAEDLRAQTVETAELVAGNGRTSFDGPAVLEKAIVRPPKLPPKHADALAEASGFMKVARERVRAWLDQSKAAEDERTRAVVARGGTDAQVSGIREKFQRVREDVAEAYRFLGDTFGVDLLGDGSSAFHGVPVELRLSNRAVSDFASRSRQTLVLRTNTYRGKATIPLSKLFRGDGSNMLVPVDEAEAVGTFDANAEATAERYIVTGNLLRGWDAANQASGGRDIGRPRVAIFTRHGGELATGVLMPPGWKPGPSETGSAPVGNAQAFMDAVQAGRRIMGSNGMVLIQGPAVRVPANMAGRRLWGDPAFRGFFQATPVQSGGKMTGDLVPGAENLGAFFDFLAARGVKLVSSSGPVGGDSQSMASRGAFVTVHGTGPGMLPTTVPMRFGGMNLVRPVELPEMVRLVRSLTSESPRVGRAGKLASGKFQGGEITLDPRIFKDPGVAAKVLAHEIGHLVDYLPDATTARGNLVGRLLALRRFMRASFGSLSGKDLRAELLAVTRWWRPYDPATDPPTYVRYRETPEELFADALSVLFNAPAELEARAPKFYAAFWERIDRRPPVRDALFDLQDLLAQGKNTVLAEREQSLDQAFAEGEIRWKKAVADRQAAARSWDGWWTRLWQELYWNFYPLEQRAAAVEKRGAKLPHEMDPRVFLDDLGYRNVTVMRWGRHVWERVVQPVEQAGMTLEDLGKFLFYQRILNGDRAGMANPGGTDSSAARLGLLKLQLDLGLDRMTVLRESARVFHEDVFKLARQAVEVGAYNRNLFKTVIEPNRDSYATFQVLDYVDDWIPAGVREQIGTLRDVANPFQATVLKSIALIHLIAYQQAKNRTVDFIDRYFPGDLEPVKGDKKPQAPKGKGVFMRLENGRPAYYLTDPYIAEAFERANPEQLWWLTRAADGIFRRFVYPLIITYNPGFLLLMSPLRDWQRTGRNLPGHFQRIRLLRNYFGTLGEASARHFRGESGPLIREMEANLGIGTPFDQIARANRDDFLGDLLRRMRVLPDHEQQGWVKSALWKPVKGILDQLEAAGMTLDTLAKTAAYQRLRASGVRPKVAGAWVRNHAGLPNINKKGLLVRQIRALVPFWNVFGQGWRADLRLMTSPTTRSGWWFKYMLSNGLARAILALAATGALGQVLKDLLAGISEYDKTNYLSVPVGQAVGSEFGRRTVFLRIPESETDRMLGAIISKGIRMAGGDDPGLSDIFDFGLGQIPSINPALSVPVKWAEFASGHNPRDPLTGRDIVSKREWAAGGVDAAGPMVSWTLGQSGLLNLVRWDPSAEATWQIALSATPGLNRFLKVSHHGYRERQRATMEQVDAIRAQAKLRLPAPVQALEAEFWHLSRIESRLRTPGQQDRLASLRKWYTTVYSPNWEALETAQDASVAASIRRSMEVASEPFRGAR